MKTALYMKESGVMVKEKAAERVIGLTVIDMREGGMMTNIMAWESLFTAREQLWKGPGPLSEMPNLLHSKKRGSRHKKGNWLNGNLSLRVKSCKELKNRNSFFL
jgi:hypothetical protein